MSNETIDPSTNALRDDHAIRELVRHYSDALTRLDAGDAAQIFAEDGVVSILGHETVGRDAIEAGMRQSFAAFQMIQMIAHGGRIQIDGDRAEGRWSTVELAIRQDDDRLHCIFGSYEDQLVRLPEGWRFVRRNFHLAARTMIETDKLQLNGDFSAVLAGTFSLADIGTA